MLSHAKKPILTSLSPVSLAKSKWQPCDLTTIPLYATKQCCGFPKLSAAHPMGKTRAVHVRLVAKQTRLFNPRSFSIVNHARANNSTARDRQSNVSVLKALAHFRLRSLGRGGALGTRGAGRESTNNILQGGNILLGTCFWDLQ